MTWDDAVKLLNMETFILIFIDIIEVRTIYIRKIIIKAFKHDMIY
jgi:hypothetical protein